MGELNPLSLTDALQRIRDRAKEIDNTRVYICLKKMRFKPVSIKAVENLKVLIALNEFNVPTTSYLFNVIRGAETNSGNGLTILHAFGDKKVLTLKRSEEHKRGNLHSWILSDAFKQYYYGKEEGK